METDNVMNVANGEISRELVKQDRVAAMFRLGISAELADMLAAMSLAQILKLAASNFLLCSFRLNEHASMSAVVGEGKDTTLQQAHMSILMARYGKSSSRSS